MTKKIVVVTGLLIMLAAFNTTDAKVSLVVNGSFEHDGEIDNITELCPWQWFDVNMVEDKFVGFVDSSWWTHSYTQDGNSMTISSDDGAVFNSEETATISQDVYLTDVNEIIFDLLLTTDWWPMIVWDHDKFSAVLILDGNDIIWNSEENPQEEYTNESVDVNDKYKDGKLHKLSLGVKANDSGGPYNVYYRARWDFVKFDTHCGGLGHLWSDFSGDCKVDFVDFAILASYWLGENVPVKYDLPDYGIINEHEIMVFADEWLDFRDWHNWEDPDFVILDIDKADVNIDGIVNFKDYAIVVSQLGSEGCCLSGDIDRSKKVDYTDVAVLAEEWLMLSWLYDLD